MLELLAHILLGVFCIVIGFSLKKKPNLLAGYNSLSAERKKKIDIEGLSTFFKNGFIIIGAIIIITSIMLNLYGKNEETFLLFVIMILGVAIMGIFSGKYDNGRNESTR